MYPNNFKPPFMTTTPSTSFASTSSFGQPTSNQNMFPSMQPTNIFQSPNTSTFSAGPSTQPQFGSNLFGQQQQQQPSTSGLFGSSNAFGQNKATFGFGSTPSQTSLFGQQPQQQSGSNLFQSNTTNLFGSTNAFGAQGQSGTLVKFAPVSGTDTMQKNGTAQTISTKHHCITCMKEYENKSLEELRFEDYSCNRKGPQQQTGFAAAPFGASAGTTTPSLFGQPESKQAFGQSSGFGQTSTFNQNTSGFGMNANQNTVAPNLFGKQTAFGTPTTNTNTFGGFNATPANTNPFTSSQAQKSSQLFFGGSSVQQPQPGFGTTPVFGQASNQPTPVFPSSGQNSFNFNQPTSTTQAAPNLFQVSKANTGFGIFGQTSTGGTSAFGQTAQTPFTAFGNKAATTSFGQPTQPAFGSALGGLQQQQQPSLFGGAATKAPTLFLTANTGTGIFGNSTFQQPTNAFSVSVQQQPIQFPPDSSDEAKNLHLIATDIYPEGKAFEGLEPLPYISNSIATNPADLKAILENAKRRDDLIGIRCMSKTQVPKLKKITSERQLPAVLPRRASAQHSNFNREFFDPTVSIRSSPRCLVIKKPNEKPTSIFSKYRNELIDEAEATLQLERNGNKVSNSPSRSNDIPNEQMVAMQLNFDSTAKTSKEFLECDEPANRIKPKSKGRTLKLSFESDSGDESEDVRSVGTYVSGAASGSLHEDHNSSEDISQDDVAPDTCYGVILTRPEYYMYPAKKDLQQFADETGHIVISGLTIGRKGYGNIYFNDSIDITNMNLDEIVHFRHREVTVYPEDSKKPPIGEGLNRPAQVTLDKIYPRGKAPNSFITDVDEIIRSNFVDKLMAVTLKHKAKFVDYRPHTGSWVFKVKHFSKYGYTTSDEEECDILQNEQNYVVKEKPRLKDVKPLKKSIEEPELRLGLGGYILSKEVEIPPLDIDIQEYENDSDVWELQSLSSVRSDRFHLKGFEYDQMKSTLFDDSDDITSPVIYKRIEINDCIDDIESPLKECVGNEIYVDPMVHELSTIPTEGMPGRTSLSQVKCCSDLAIFKSEGYKVGWSGGCKLIRFEPYYDFEISYGLNNYTVNVTGTTSYDLMMPTLTKILEVTFNTSTIEIDTNLIPTCHIDVNQIFLEDQTKLFNDHVVKQNLVGKKKYLMHIWNLCYALWFGGHKPEYVRKEQLSNWLIEATRDLCNEPFDSNPTVPKNIFQFLTFHKINEAVELAMNNNLSYMSVFISQGMVETKEFLKLYHSTTEWQNDAISIEFKKIYLLLAGIPNKDGVNICENLDWKRCMGLYLWYIALLDFPIGDSMDLFKECFENGYCASPVPPHTNDEYDLLYHIILLYSNNLHSLSKLLNPTTHTKNSMDYRFSWIMLQLFKSLNIGHINVKEEQYLHTSFASQLEEMGLWKWSIIVLLYVEDQILKKNLIMGLLERNLSAFGETAEIEIELVCKYKIPTKWIHEIKAYQCQCLGRRYECFQHLIYTEKISDAGNLFANSLLPELFLNNQFELIKLMALLQPYSETLENWKNQIGLVGDYLKLQKIFTENCDDYQLKECAPAFHSVIDRLDQFSVKSEKHTLVLAELGRRCALMFKMLYKDLESKEFCIKFNKLFQKRVMPADCKQYEIECLADLQLS